jgi:large subunit ribosomal protein L22
MPQKGARLIRKTVKSAASNALSLSGNKQLDEDMLYVREISIDEGPRLKRVWFRGRGRADMQLKRMCHITVVIDELAVSPDQKKRTGDQKKKQPNKKAEK